MEKKVTSLVCALAALLVIVCCGCSKKVEAVELVWQDPNKWQSDGMWKVSSCEEGLMFLKDEKAAVKYFKVAKSFFKSINKSSEVKKLNQRIHRIYAMI